MAGWSLVDVMSSSCCISQLITYSLSFFHTHTHTRKHTLSTSLTPTHSLSLSLTPIESLSNYLSNSVPLSHTLYLSPHSPSLSLSLLSTDSLTLHFFSFKHTLYLFLSFTLTHLLFSL